jgi:hypothetical protein
MGSWQEATDDFNAPMRVVLMRRTMAGQSSLLSALSRSHFDSCSRRDFAPIIPGKGAFQSDLVCVVDHDSTMSVGEPQPDGRTIRHHGVDHA